jgi:hypothetical protein
MYALARAQPRSHFPHQIGAESAHTQEVNTKMSYCRTNYTPRVTTDALRKTVQSLAEAIANGGSDQAFDQYLTWISRLHRYSWGNIGLMMTAWKHRQEANPSIPPLGHVASFRTWRKMNRHVRRGEKGLPILVPIELNGKTVTDDETGEDEYLRPRTVFRVGYVFDESQTEGDETPNWKQDLGPEAAQALPLLTSLAREHGIEVTFEPLGDANGYSAGGRIAINSLRPAGIQVQTMIHEIAHELLEHAKSLKHAAEPPSKAVVEGEAEAVTVVVMRALGHDTASNGAAYIRSHGGDAKTITASLERIAKTAKTILEGIETPSTENDAEQAQTGENAELTAA